MSFSNFERLTPLDLIMPKVYIATILTFETTESSLTLQSAFQKGLEKLATQIPWVSGRVFPTNQKNKASLEMRWNQNTTPALIDKGILDRSYKELSANGMPPSSIPRNLRPVSDMVEHNPIEQGAPVFAASIFRFGDGEGIGLYICMHHNVVDAAGLFETVKLWAQNTTQTAASSSFCDQSLSSLGRVTRLSEALSSDLHSVSTHSLDDLFASHPEYSRAPLTLPSEFPSCTTKVFAIPMLHIDIIKHRLGNYMSTTPTTNTLVCALVWSAITNARMQRDPALELKYSRLVTAVNGRRRLGANKKFPAENPYFGNMVLYALAIIQGKDLSVFNNPGSTSFKSLAELCEVIAESQSPARVNSRYVAEVHQLVESVDDYRSVFVGWDLFESKDLTMTSWADLNFYGLEFGLGLGTPEFVRVPYTEADGVGLVLPRRACQMDDIGGGEVVEVMVMLRRDDMVILEEGGLCGSFL
ncbi:transferase family-domain-containing protein [Penicillium nucicola]|uniref:transferase family-domain-containing protein n=1 Tax=Penicillium nucicola TaxID=1850975 RepID=UPI002544F0D5|nr:transferase family-domain-containing protein [Penicillium nucicola]KAJ5757935.1 transferase family-domain-containing protein [Penicillium nucicola]